MAAQARAEAERFQDAPGLRGTSCVLASPAMMLDCYSKLPHHVEVMISLMKSELRKIRSDLAKWRTPSELKAICNQICEEVDGKTFFNKGGLTFITEAIVAADFGVERAASLVRLTPENEERPDFELDFGDRIEKFEMVQADRKGRRRGDEYKAKAELPVVTGSRLGVPLPDEITEMVRTAACKKAKPYPPGTRLVIYLEAPKSRSYEFLLGASFTDAVYNARPFFSAIWVMWQGTPYEIS